MPSNTLKNSKISKISILIPTLNSGKILSLCLDSIKKQDYSNYEIIIIDGGSTDNTIDIAKKYHCQIIENPLKSAEAGKALGLKNATGEYIALIDSDNILPNSTWLSQMLLPFFDPQIIGSEPIAFTYRKQAGFIERYSALIGANDPYAYILGISDRTNYINFKWTSLNIPQKDFKTYIKAELVPKQSIPTIGANGTIFRSNFLKKYFTGDYLFDIDLITQALNITGKSIYFAKVKTDIIHTFCESSIKKFIRKQNRRLRDYFAHIHERQYDYANNFNQNFFYNIYLLIKNNLVFSLYSLLIIPALIDSLRGFLHKPDFAWFFHPIACLITLFIYVYISILSILGVNLKVNRLKWQQ